MNDKLRQLMQESKERGPRQEEPLDGSTLKSVAEEYDPVSAWAAVSMAQEILRLRAENAAMRPIVEAVAKPDATVTESGYGYCEDSEKLCTLCDGKPVEPDKPFYHAPDCPTVLAGRVLEGMKE